MEEYQSIAPVSMLYQSCEYDRHCCSLCSNARQRIYFKVHCPAYEEPRRDDEPDVVGVRHSRQEGDPLGGGPLQRPDDLQGKFDKY